MTATMPTVPCETCGTPTTFTGTKRCDDCHEVEMRLLGYLRRGDAKARGFVIHTLAEHAAGESKYDPERRRR